MQLQSNPSCLYMKALVFYQFPCLDASFYYSILSPLKSVVSGKTIKVLQKNQVSLINRLRIHGCEMEFPEGSWSVAVEIGGLNCDPKKEKMLVSVRTGITAIRRALKEVNAEPAEKSIRMVVLWTGGCDMEFPKGSWSGSKEIGGLNSDKSGIACSFRPGVRGIRWVLEEVDAEPIGRLFWTVVGPVPTLDAFQTRSSKAKSS
ncbi:hypothetical protein RHGRI_025573 [Rhododendron griersonianum]|uniref:Uncharacterized protein n=1 Tax=Rhododendron griersonianum TaxID=479676 RepID=A0AAV6IPG9_9ERIC|nr:hypothetical protein RHGRI_025573 [Rhododendron griersonianum]